MDRNAAYVSSIPVEAREKVTQIWGDRSRKRAEYYLGKELVGIRTFYRTGELECESSWKNGIQHGMYYTWCESGKLRSCEPYENGKPHGTAYQWADDGRLLGSYTMDHGTGIDLWWQEWHGEVTLAEVYYKQNGERHGFEWWFFAGPSPYEERHWYHGDLHGIERDWNHRGGVRRGWPRYYIHGERVTKRQYLAACKKDETLPLFRAEDNAPHRTFPPEIARHLRPRR